MENKEELGASDDRALSPSATEPVVSAHSGNGPSRVIDYINEAVPSEVFEEYLSRYSDDGWASDETWSRFKNAVNARIAVKSSMSVVLTEVHERWSEHPGCGEDEKHIDVSGDDGDGNGPHWALDFTPWSEWKTMRVEDRSGLSLTPSQIAAHIFYEMAWHGWEEEGATKLAEIEDRAEAIERGFATAAPFNPKDTGQ